MMSQVTLSPSRTPSTLDAVVVALKKAADLKARTKATFHSASTISKSPGSKKPAKMTLSSLITTPTMKKLLFAAPMHWKSQSATTAMTTSMKKFAKTTMVNSATQHAGRRDTKPAGTKRQKKSMKIA